MTRTPDPDHGMILPPLNAHSSDCYIFDRVMTRCSGSLQIIGIPTCTVSKRKHAHLVHTQSRELACTHKYTKSCLHGNSGTLYLRILDQNLSSLYSCRLHADSPRLAFNYILISLYSLLYIGHNYRLFGEETVLIPSTFLVVSVVCGNFQDVHRLVSMYRELPYIPHYTDIANWLQIKRELQVKKLDTALYQILKTGRQYYLKHKLYLSPTDNLIKDHIQQVAILKLLALVFQFKLTMACLEYL